MNIEQNAINFCHEWYADKVSHSIMYLGVPIMKNVFDLWNYQEIIWVMKPSLIIETGTACGASALWFADLMQVVNPNGMVVTVDSVDWGHPEVKAHPMIRREVCSSADPVLAWRLLELRTEYPGPVFAILDSDHKKPHVLAEMELFRGILKTGDYLVVEDGNINGHPIYAGWGEGPFEAIQEYERLHPGDYTHDDMRERKFPFTFAERGYLIRT